MNFAEVQPKKESSMMMSTLTMKMSHHTFSKWNQHKKCLLLQELSQNLYLEMDYKK